MSSDISSSTNINADGNSSQYVVELKRNLMAHGEARGEKWRGKRRMEWVASTHALYGNTVYPALLTLMSTPRLPAADWTDNPADINGLVRFAGRPTLVSARVPSHSVSTLTRCYTKQLRTHIRTPIVTWPTSLLAEHNPLVLSLMCDHRRCISVC